MRIEEFLTQAGACPSVAAAIVLVEDATGSLGDLAIADVGEWFERLPTLLDWQEPSDVWPADLEEATYEGAPDDAALDAATERLLEVLAERVARARIEVDLTPFANLLVGWAANSSTSIALPRRWCFPIYKQWIVLGSAPALTAYLDQVLRSCPAGELVDLGELLVASPSQESWVDEEFVRRGLAHVRWAMPERVPAWLEVLEGSGDPFDEALCRLHRRWLARLPAAREAEDVRWLGSYLRLEWPGWHDVESAWRSLQEAGADAVPVSVDDLREMIERDMRRARPRVPRHVEVAVQSVESSALGLLQDRARSHAAGGLSPLTECALLSMALEQHLRAVLCGAVRDKRARAAIGALGLKGLADFVLGDRLSRLAGLRCEHEFVKDVVTGLRRCGRIRNEVHHEPGKVGEVQADDVRRLLVGPAGSTLFEAIGPGLRVRGRLEHG